MRTSAADRRWPRTMERSTPRARIAAASPAWKPIATRVVEATSRGGERNQGRGPGVSFGDGSGGQQRGGEGHAAAGQPPAQLLPRRASRPRIEPSERPSRCAAAS